MAGADDDSTPPPKTPKKTQYLEPRYVVGSEEETKAKLQALSREKAAEKKHLDTQFTGEARTMIDQHPYVKASTLATRLQSRPETRSLPGVTLPNGEAMKHPSLAKKIGRYRRRK